MKTSLAREMFIRTAFINKVLPSVLSWLFLIALTFLSVYITDFIDSKLLFIGSVLLIVFIKGQQIIDIFMELKHAPKRWRFLLLSYVILIPLIISVIYIL